MQHSLDKFECAAVHDSIRDPGNSFDGAVLLTCESFPWQLSQEADAWSTFLCCESVESND